MINSVKKNHSINITTINIKGPVISSFKESSLQLSVKIESPIDV